MARSLSGGVAAKLAVLGVVDAFAVYGLVALGGRRSWWLFAAMLAGTVAINVIYLGSRRVPAKYLAPGVILLLVYQVYVVLYTGYAAFTNYGDGHNGTKQDAVAAILAASETRVPGSVAQPIRVVERGGELGFLVNGPGGARVGSAVRPLEPVAATGGDASGGVGAGGWRTLTYSEIVARQAEITALRVPVPGEGSLRTSDAVTAAPYRSTLSYDGRADTVTDPRTGVVYRDDGHGRFAAPGGAVLSPGWKVFVGFENFLTVLTDPGIRAPFLGVLVWTFAFAALSVGLTFAIGLGLALVLGRPELRGLRAYRSLLVLPYAFPAFMAALLWQGLLNPDHGFLNAVLLGGGHVPWLTDPWLAKLSVLAVNVWIGFPYMFLICTGALQAIPPALTEAAQIDGAGPWRVLREIKLPILLASVTPVLVATFAFNFNNFNVIYMLTGGGPRDPRSPVDVGSTDLLISLVYKLAFGGSARNYGLACAVSILIFAVIAAISLVGFRRARRLEAN
ncbi:ABC transporter permease subunit [Streptosporangium roseum]|uniref:Maltose/maltodextrin transport system permease protein n=1 Tax=Streptosporangium roseum (strain ATCC 12428 / DSM 43021 / JCM 3005 / KCTC 9067 / NCIMB 10171 / NRRL 2505 / NI 9100) TaxID=479432 RepID=D2B814_STRRD|nr:ABC transporter permease subunit [Streptosporangium roseum]ACZ83945.1 maltose transporter membrane protein [Streptosporangium roseum DSM 43021]